MKLIQAIALDRPREVSTKFGPRLVIDAVSRDTGERITLWRGSDDDYSRKYIIKNSPITIGVDSKGKFSLVENESLTNLENPLPVSPVPVKSVHSYNHKIEENSEKTSDSDQSLLTPSQKREIASYVSEMAKLYGFCLTQSESLGLEGEDRRTVATTLFIQASKHFNL